MSRRELPFPKGTRVRVPDATFNIFDERYTFHAITRYGEIVEVGNRHISQPDADVYVHDKRGGVRIMSIDVLECCEAIPDPLPIAEIRVIAS